MRLIDSTPDTDAIPSWWTMIVLMDRYNWTQIQFENEMSPGAARALLFLEEQRSKLREQ